MIIRFTYSYWEKKNERCLLQCYLLVLSIQNEYATFDDLQYQSSGNHDKGHGGYQWKER